MTVNIYDSADSVAEVDKTSAPVPQREYADSAISGHVHGFDYARCLFAVMVVALHTRALGASAKADVVYDHFFSLAVPSFILISLFLFVAKGNVTGRSLAQRVERLLLLFVFWSAAHAIVFHKTEDILRGCESATGLVRTAVKGGNDIFYFFSCLAFVTIVAAAVCRLAPRVLWTLALVATCGLWVMSSLAGGRLSEELANYYNPLNFVPYAFVAPLVVDQVRQGSLKSSAAKTVAVFALLFMTWLIATLLEPHYLHTADGRWPSAYSRPSAVLGAVTVICLFLLISRPAPRIVQRLADCSLGIYCVHIFVKPSAGIAAVPNHFAQFLIVLIVSIAIVAFLRYALARQMI